MTTREYSPEIDEKGAEIERPTGVVQGILADVIELPEAPDPFKPGKMKKQLIFVYQLMETLTVDGKEVRFCQTEFLTDSLHEKSTMRKRMEAILGCRLKALYKKAEAMGKKSFRIDLDKLVGRNLMLTISKKEDSNYTRIDSAAPLMKGLEEQKLEGYERPEWIADKIKDMKSEEQIEAEREESLEDVDLSSIIDSM